MKILVLFLFAFLLAAPMFAQKKKSNNAMSQKRMTPEAMGYKLFWDDQFNGHQLDTSKWSVRHIGPVRIGYNSPEAVKVKNGYLKLYALQKGDSILGCAVGTADHLLTRYGYFECRAQLQESSGVWAAFWIQSLKIAEGEDPSLFGTEIDILFIE